MAHVFLKPTGQIAALMVMMLMTLEITRATRRPHIIFIVADDLGWNDVQWRNQHMHTPVLKRLMEDGILLNNSYMQYYCSPSRSAIMSGLYPYHTGLQHIVIEANQPVGLREDLTILPQALQRLGYATHAIGKWHLGFCKWEYTPTERGFDSFLGFYNSHEDHYTREIYGGYDFRLNRDVYSAAGQKYATEVFADRAIEVLNEHDMSQPLFLYLSFAAVHTPLQVPEEYETEYCSHIREGNRRTYCGMAAAMDEAVGKVVRKLEELDYMDNLLLVFTSDNGGGRRRTTGGSNRPLRGYKGTLFEGGTRVPAFVYSPNLFGTTKRVHEGLIHAVDWFPTLMTLANGESEIPGGIDGVSQWRSIVEDEHSPRNEFVYNIDSIDQTAAIRVGNYKLIQAMTSGTYDYKLYNLRDDPTERNDIKDDNPGLLEAMIEKLEQYKESEVDPDYPANDPASDPNNWGGIWSPGWCAHSRV